MPLLETLLLVSTAVQAAGQVTSAIGNRRAASAAEREGDRLADDAIARGERDVELYEMDLARLLGTQRAVAGANMLDVDQGSALQLRTQAERFGVEDVTTIRENAMREAYGLRRGARNQAQQLRWQATGDLFGAAGNVFNLGANAWDIRQRTRAQARSAVSRTSDLMGQRRQGYVSGLQRTAFGG